MAHTTRNGFQANSRGLTVWGAVLVVVALLAASVQLFAGHGGSSDVARIGMPTSIDADVNYAP